MRKTEQPSPSEQDPAASGEPSSSDAAPGPALATEEAAPGSDHATGVPAGEDPGAPARAAPGRSRTDDAPAPPHAPPDPLRILRWLAILGVAALVLGRFVAPALPGLGVGVTRVARAFEVVGGLLSQLFALGLLVGLSTALIQTANSTIPAWIRLVAMLFATDAALTVVGGAAAADRAPGTSALIAAAGAGLFAIIAAVASRASRVVRLAASAIGVVGAAAVVRAVGGLTILHADKLLAPASLVTIGRVTATVSAVLVAIAVALAIVYVSRAAPAGADGPEAARPSLWSPVTLVTLVLAAVCARQAAAGALADAGTVSVLLKRAADRFLVQPEPFLRMPIRLFLGFLTPLTAIALLTVRRLPALTSALCLALVVADVTDAPLGPLALMQASLGVLLVARSGHLLWSALVALPPAAPRGPGGGGAGSSPAASKPEGSR